MKRLLLLGVAIVTIFYPICGISQLYDFDTHTFTNAGALGKDGPNLGACQAAYAAEVWELDPALFNMTTQGIQEWTVPVTGTYEIEAAGAQGGNDLYTVNPEDGGLGARMIGTFDLTEGDVLYILVGQKGEDTRVTGIDNAAAGGGGGTFIWDPTDDALPMVAAGGGAGGSGFDYAGRNATDAEDGQNAFSFVNGGIGGNGGRLNTGGSSYWAGGGAGWLTNGTGGNQGTLYLYTGSYAQGGRRPLEGGIGGVRFNDGNDEGGDGGFGGGGGGGSDNMGTGGGGGYSGGGGQNGNEFPSMNSGGGGGSYNGGTDQDNTAAINTGHGYVTITLLCNPISVEAFEDVLCEGEEIILDGTADSGDDVTWDLGVVNGESFAPPVGVTVYTGSTENIDDCDFQTTITVNALPVVTASVDDDEICLGDEFTFTGGGATSYSWDMGVTDAVAFEPLTAGTETYTVTGTDDNGCENTASVDATVNALPVVTASVDDDEICLGDEFTFTGGGATSYSWDMGVTDGVAFEPLTVGTETYTVIGTDDNGCENTASVDATVNALPVVTASVDDDEICFGESVIFTGGGATSYSWDMGVVDGDPFTPLTSGTETYTVTGTDDNGCENTASVDVTVNPELVVTYTTVDETDEDGEIDLTVTGGTPGYTFDWDTDEADDFDDPEDLTDLLAGTYTVIIRDANGCEVIEVIEINSLCIPIAIVASELSVCQNELLTLTGTAESGGAIIWDEGVTDGVGFFPEMVGVITYTATTDDPTDCPSTIDIEVLAVPTVLPTIGGELYCAGDEIVLGAGGDADEYTWSPMDFTPEVGVTTYTLTGTYDDSGCSASETIDVTVYDVPTVNATADLEEVCIGNPITLTGTGAESYVWDPIAIENGTPYTIGEVGTFTYTVVGTDANGCSDSDEIDITVNEEIEISYIVTEEMIFEDGEINITVTGGVTPYTFDWDIDGTGDFDDDEDLTGLADDLYTVVVNGATGCSAEVSIVVGTQASVGEFEGLNFNVYPNPTNDLITIQLDGSFSYVLTDISGKIISIGTSHNQEKLSLLELESGLYLLKIKNENNYETIQVVKN